MLLGACKRVYSLQRSLPQKNNQRPCLQSSRSFISMCYIGQAPACCSTGGWRAALGLGHWLPLSWSHHQVCICVLSVWLGQQWKFPHTIMRDSLVSSQLDPAQMSSHDYIVWLFVCWNKVILSPPASWGQNAEWPETVGKRQPNQLSTFAAMPDVNRTSLSRKFRKGPVHLCALLF